MRSKLFVPGSRPEWFAKALESDADALSIDLADAVDASEKARARVATGDFVRSLPRPRSKLVIVRVNAITSAYFDADAEAIAAADPDLVNIPRVESIGDVSRAAAALHGIAILANIETAKGLRAAAEIASHQSVAGLQLGLADLLEPLSIDRCDPQIVLQLQLAMRLACGEAEVFAYDSAYPFLDDEEGLRREADGAKRLGYLGKSAIHPRQVPIINDVFQPSEQEIAFARKVVASAREKEAAGIGAWTVDGKLVDAPFLVRARNTLALAQRLGLA